MKQRNKEVLTINQRECLCFTSGNPKYLLINLIDKRDELSQENIFNEILKVNNNLIYVSLIIDDWKRELSPWVSPAVSGKEDFKGEASKTLNFINNDLLPTIINKYSLDKNIIKIIGGYSLAGLFSLWSVYQSNLYSAVVSCSPSVWFPDFLNYTKTNQIKTKNVYLSLGDKEEKTKNKTMSLVGNNIRELSGMYLKDSCIENSILEWNVGNHFVDVDKRMLKGYIWAINQLK